MNGQPRQSAERNRRGRAAPYMNATYRSTLLCWNCWGDMPAQHESSLGLGLELQGLAVSHDGEMKTTPRLPSPTTFSAGLPSASPRRPASCSSGSAVQLFQISNSNPPPRHGDADEPSPTEAPLVFISQQSGPSWPMALITAVSHGTHKPGRVSK